MMSPTVASRIYFGRDKFILVVLANKAVIKSNPVTGRMENVDRVQAAGVLRAAKSSIQKIMRPNPTCTAEQRTHLENANG